MYLRLGKVHAKYNWPNSLANFHILKSYGMLPETSKISGLNFENLQRKRAYSNECAVKSSLGPVKNQLTSQGAIFSY